MTFTEVANDLSQTVNLSLPDLAKIANDEAGRRPQPEKWSKKEIIGHLLDSARNNHQRIVRAALEGGLKYPGYDQAKLVELQRYREIEWRMLLNIWEGHNRLLAHVLQQVPEGAASFPVAIGGTPGDTMIEMVEDYVAHLKHHLNQLLGKRFETSYDAET